jgi:hypothetical protein
MLVLFLVAMAVRPAAAGELAHYVPALPNVRDTVMPHPGFHLRQYFSLYTTDTFRDRFGDRQETITGPLGTVDADDRITIFSLAPTALWVGDCELLRGRVGALLQIPFGNPSIQVDLRTEAGFGLDPDESTFGLGDLYVQPVWLGWSGKHWDASLAYGFYAPTGRYENDESDNLGLGFWTNQLQATGAYYPWEHRDTAIVLATTYEISTDMQHADLRPGDRISLNLGASHYLALGADQRWRLELAAGAYAQWQIEKDSGGDASPFLGQDHIYALGPQVGIVQTEWKASLVLRWQHELGAQSRYEGDWVGLTIAKAF